MRSRVVCLLSLISRFYVCVLCVALIALFNVGIVYSIGCRVGYVLLKVGLMLSKLTDDVVYGMWYST